jgi:hypothetical protein
VKPPAKGRAGRQNGGKGAEHGDDPSRAELGEAAAIIRHKLANRMAAGVDRVVLSRTPILTATDATE